MKSKNLLKMIIISIVEILFFQICLSAINYYDLLGNKLRNVDNSDKINIMYEYLDSLTPEQQLLLTRQMFDAHIKYNEWPDAGAGIQLVLYKYPKTIQNMQLIINDIKNYSLNQIYRTALIWLISTQEFSQSLSMDLFNQLNTFIINEIQNDKLSTNLRKQYIFELGELLRNFNLYNKSKDIYLLKESANNNYEALIHLINQPKTDNNLKFEIFRTLNIWNQIKILNKDFFTVLKNNFLKATDANYKKSLAGILYVGFNDYETVERELPNFKDEKIRERLASDMRLYKKMLVEDAERAKKMKEAAGKNQ